MIWTTFWDGVSLSLLSLYSDHCDSRRSLFLRWSALRLEQPQQASPASARHSISTPFSKSVSYLDTMEAATPSTNRRTTPSASN